LIVDNRLTFAMSYFIQNINEMEILLIAILFLVILCIVLLFLFRPTANTESQNIIPRLDALQANLTKMENNLKEDFKINREENASIAKDNRSELNNTIKDFKTELTQILTNITRQNQQAWLQINQALEDKLELLNRKLEENNKASRESLSGSFKDFTLEQRNKFDELKLEQKELTHQTVGQLEKITVKVEEKLTALTVQDKIDNQLMRETLGKTFEDFGAVFDKNVESFNNLQREKFGQLEERQSKMMESTEKKLEEMRATVDEKLQKTLNERLGQSFELVGRQLENVQKGLGEMQTLAQDVGGLKRVLSNVKMRGGIGEVQLAMLLEQVLAPEQYAANVRTKTGSTDLVEFAIKLPGRDENNSVVWLPVDAKFPKDVYEQLLTAYDIGELSSIETAQKLLDTTIKKMAKDIRDKYIDPPNTTDFGIMFLPFEGIYAEVVRKADLLDELQRVYKIVITGPTTLAAILNSLQMGFKTMAIQKRSGEVWQILGAVKREFELFGGMMEKAQNNIQTGLNQLDDVMGKRTRAIQRKLRSVETLGEAETKLILPEGIEDIIVENEE
jgi:DNA recombination protein RmuC